jgi:hypothetical protein
MTMRFSVPIWISSPAKVKKLGVVEKVVMSIYDAQGDASDAITNNDLLLGTRMKFTPYGYQTLLLGNKLQALSRSAVVNPTNDNTDPQPSPTSNELWPAILGLYGQYRPGITQIRLDNQWGDNTQVVGTVVVDPNDARFLLIDLDQDTLPQNTLPPVNSVINPLVSGPGQGLPVSAQGQYYLILDDIGSDVNSLPAQAWGGVVAQANDIITFNDGIWQVSFDSTDSEQVQFTTNVTTGLQYRWTGQEWVKSYQGLYPGGEWSIVL